MATKPKSVNRLNGHTNGEATASPAKTVTLQHLQREKMGCSIRGTTPLIVHAWSEKAIRMIEDKQQKKGTTGQRAAKDPQAEYEGCFYRDEEGRSCIPARAVKKAIVSAATSLNDIRNFSKTKLRQGLFVLGDLLPLKASKPRMRTDMVRVQGNADVRYRPEFEKWEVDLVIEYNAAVFSPEQIVNLLNVAGFAVGLCENRPEKDGSNGRFEVVQS